MGSRVNRQPDGPTNGWLRDCISPLFCHSFSVIDTLPYALTSLSQGKLSQQTVELAGLVAFRLNWQSYPSYPSFPTHPDHCPVDIWSHSAERHQKIVQIYTHNALLLQEFLDDKALFQYFSNSKNVSPQWLQLSGLGRFFRAQYLIFQVASVANCSPWITTAATSHKTLHFLWLVMRCTEGTAFKFIDETSNLRNLFFQCEIFPHWLTFSQKNRAWGKSPGRNRRLQQKPQTTWSNHNLTSQLAALSSIS